MPCIQMILVKCSFSLLGKELHLGTDMPPYILHYHHEHSVPQTADSGHKKGDFLLQRPQ